MTHSKLFSFLLILLALLSTQAFARKKAVAILETGIEGKKAKLDPAELAYITEEFRGVALEALGTLQYHIMTKDNIMMMLPPGKSLSECVGECIVETGKNVGADFVTQGVVRKVGRRLSFTSSLYDTKNNQLKGSVRVLAKDIDGLIDGITKKAPKLFVKLIKSLNEKGFKEGVANAASSTMLKVIFRGNVGVKLTLNGDEYCDDGLPCIENVPMGKYEMKATKEGYDPIDSILVVDRDKLNVNLDFGSERFSFFMILEIV